MTIGANDLPEPVTNIARPQSIAFAFIWKMASSKVTLIIIA